MSKPKDFLSLPHILSRLLADKGLKERDLVKVTALPQTTINNILRGISKNPRPATLEAISKVFNMSVSQLMGYKGLERACFADTDSPIKAEEGKETFLPPLTIPLIQWEEVRPWIIGQGGIRAYTTWLPNNICKSQKAFALRVKASMHSYFLPHKQVGNVHTATLLIDPDGSLEDGKVILIFLNESREPSLRLLAIEGEEKWLQPLEGSRPSIVLNQNHSVIGPVVEVRYRYNPEFK